MKKLLLLLLFIPLLACWGFIKDSEENNILNDSVIIATPSRLTLLFAGDFMQHQTQIDAAKTKDGYDYSDCFKHLKDEISSADIAIGNLEVTLGGKPYTGYPAFSAPDEFLYALHDAGFDIMLTANNHCLDRGQKGLERTIAILDSMDIPYAGTYINDEERSAKYPLLIEENDIRVVLLNYTYGTNGIEVREPNVVNFIDKAVMATDIEKAKEMNPDAIIACMHWGEEYVQLPSKEQIQLAEWLLSQGVDHIIGSHPHVVQPVELHTDSLNNKQNIVLYSLGNFISNMSAKNTDGGMMFKMTLEKDSITRVKDCGYSLVWTERPVISGKKNFVLYPVSFSLDSLGQASGYKLNNYTKETRTLMNKHNQNVEEYILF